MKGSPPKAREADTYGEHAVDFMLRMSQLGVNEAIKAEVETPSWDNAHWCDMVIRLAERRGLL